jgi:hypothetical protein
MLATLSYTERISQEKGVDIRTPLPVRYALQTQRNALQGGVCPYLSQSSGASRSSRQTS